MPNPLAALAYCNIPSKNNGHRANYLVSSVTPDGVASPIDFGWSSSGSTKYNPNVLPYPPGSPHPYFGLGRVTRRKKMMHHDIDFCDLDWSFKPVTNRKVLKCADTTIASTLKMPDWPSAKGACKKFPYLTMAQGHTDPRIFFSPLGEPIMIVGTNGKHNCLNQWIVDLRMFVPELSKKMDIEHVPIRFKRFTELTRPDLQEVEKNWFFLFDQNNTSFIQHETEHRSISPLQPLPGVNNRNLANPKIVPQCITELTKTFKDKKNMANDIHQGTNSLRVTLCDFPCVPTIHNTVLVELMHVKYKYRLELYYKRFAIIMNATVPFDIIGRTQSLMYAGIDYGSMVYTVSIVWDHANIQTHPPWDDAIHNGKDVWDVLEERDMRNWAKAAKIEPDNGEDDIIALHDNIKQTLAQRPAVNAWVNKYYHGWLDDTIMINFGIRDKESSTLHIKARDLLQCIKLCN
ncbi:hypothetical protein V1514DRAFT_346612 [Lipomyces japonicus]|uniref:uncharacterized protein n=1 Tax=Lipomyces japonicus TaxID=56871 RepID=UPI0034CFBED9